jgi:hypothetical protein
MKIIAYDNFKPNVTLKPFDRTKENFEASAK